MIIIIMHVCNKFNFFLLCIFELNVINVLYDNKLADSYKKKNEIIHFINGKKIFIYKLHVKINII